MPEYNVHQYNLNIVVGTLKIDGENCNVVWDSEHEMVYALTPCCNATGKGWDVETPVVCRHCYLSVSTAFGDCVPDVKTEKDARLAVNLLRTR